MKNTYKSILQEMSERTLKSDTLEGDAQLFALLRQTACASGDLPAMADVDNAVLMAVEKCRAERGDDAACRLWTLYEYSNAGATLGCDFATAMSNGDTSFAEAIYSKAKQLSEQLAEKRELRDAFGALFRQFSAVS
ncbi:MAG: hypothetical protein V8S70_07050 [Muribaculaceae bacterium]|jgi:hypothetical protein|uniref:hypothetical protein n=1 Tax=Candidatus Limisoma sp. TaxID=3076476 RepID=UPI000AEFB3A2